MLLGFSVSFQLPEHIDGLGRQRFLTVVNLILVLKVLLIDVYSVVLFDAVLHDLDTDR